MLFAGVSQLAVGRPVSTMENPQALGTRGTDHQQVILKRNVRSDDASGTLTRPAGPDHQHVILRRSIQSDRERGPDHQQVVLKRSEASVQTLPIKQIDAQGEFRAAPQPPTTSEAVNNSNGRPQPAEVYIFNHQDFSSGKSRSGSSEDVEALRKTFEKLQCKVKEIRNPTLAMVKSEVSNLARKQFLHQSALVVAILSHGRRMENIETCDQKLYNLDDDVLFPLFENPTLRGTPKILIVQACKGTMKADASPCEKRCDPRDYIKCYSTTEGFLSYRDELEGSIYIQTLCKVMDQDALTKDFRRIVEDVNTKVAEESIQRRSSEGNYKQVPATCSTLNRPYCFGDYVQSAT